MVINKNQSALHLKYGLQFILVDFSVPILIKELEVPLQLLVNFSFQ